MARDLHSLLSPSPLRSLNGGAEAIVIHTRTRLDPKGVSEHPDLADIETAHACGWVSVCDSTVERRLRRAMREQFLDGDCRVVEALGPNWSEGLAAMLMDGLPEGMDLSLEIQGTWSGDLFVQVQGLLDRIRASACRLGVVVLVSEDPQLWSQLTGITGHVKSNPGAVASDACAVFESLAALSAPFALNCIDSLDLAEVLGSADHPSVVVPAIWLPADDRVVLPMPRHESLLRAAGGIVGHARGQIGRLDEHRRLLQALRAVCPGPDVNILLHGTANLMAWPAQPMGAVPLVLITASAN